MKKTNKKEMIVTPEKLKTKLNAIVVLLGLLAVSCGDDDNDNPSSAFVGKWKEVTYEFVECPDPDDNYYRACEQSNTCETWEFKTDGTFTRTTSTGLVSTLNYSVLNSTRVDFCQSGCSAYTYTMSGNTLVITEFTDVLECLTRYTLTKI